jgi:adenosylcobinamide-GDP ribazoletransferase
MPAARAAIAAVGFLTRVPLGRRLQLQAGEVTRGAAFFPLVGAGIGAGAGVVAEEAVRVLPPLTAGGLAVAAGALLTGALHLDALADTADALGAPSRDRALAIMRDHRIGSFGAVALVCDLTIRASATGALASAGFAVPALAAAGACSRAVGPVLAALLPYARPGTQHDGLAAGWSWPAAATAAALGLAMPTLLRGLDGIFAAFAVALLAASLALFFFRWLGGVTGDCLGAAIELAETLALTVLLALR